MEEPNWGRLFPEDATSASIEDRDYQPPDPQGRSQRDLVDWFKRTGGRGKPPGLAELSDGEGAE